MDRGSDNNLSSLSNQGRLLYVVNHFVRNLTRDRAGNWHSHWDRVGDIHNSPDLHWVCHGDCHWHIHTNRLRHSNDLGLDNRDIHWAGNNNTSGHNPVDGHWNLHALVTSASEWNLHRHVNCVENFAFDLHGAFNWNRHLDLHFSHFHSLNRLGHINLHRNCLGYIHVLDNLVSNRDPHSLHPWDSYRHLNLLNDLHWLRNVDCDSLDLLNRHRNGNRNGNRNFHCHRNSVVDCLHNFHRNRHVVRPTHRLGDGVRNLYLHRNLNSFSNWDSHRHPHFHLDCLGNINGHRHFDLDRDWNSHGHRHLHDSCHWDRHLDLHNDFSSHWHRHLHRHLHRHCVGHVLAHRHCNRVVDSDRVGNIDRNVVGDGLLSRDCVRSIDLDTHSSDHLVGSWNLDGHRDSHLHWHRDIHRLVHHNVISHRHRDGDIDSTLHSIRLINWSGHSYLNSLSANGLNWHWHWLGYSLRLHNFDGVRHVVGNLHNLLLTLSLGLVLSLIESLTSQVSDTVKIDS